jgi:hypothetical protein
MRVEDGELVFEGLDEFQAHCPQAATSIEDAIDEGMAAGASGYTDEVIAEWREWRKTHPQGWRLRDALTPRRH